MKKLPPQPHKTRYYLYSIQPSQISIDTESGVTGKFIGVIRHVSSVALIEGKEQDTSITWYTTEEFDSPARAAEEMLKDMGNPTKP